MAKANKALKETVVLMHERDEDDSVIMSEVGPSLPSPELELQSESESSNWEHDGNGVPCKSFNRDGCTRGVECSFPQITRVCEIACGVFSSAFRSRG